MKNKKSLLKIMDEKKIKKKVEIEFRMRDFTKYINRVLRKEDLVEDWSFAVGVMHEDCLELTIDYLNDFHSRDIYDIRCYDIEQLQREFDYYFKRHVIEWGEKHEKVNE